MMKISPNVPPRYIHHGPLVGACNRRTEGKQADEHPDGTSPGGPEDEVQPVVATGCCDTTLTRPLSACCTATRHPPRKATAIAGTDNSAPEPVRTLRAPPRLYRHQPLQ